MNKITNLKKELSPDVQHAFVNCKTAFTYIALFSMVINILMLIPSLYMMQVYDRVITTGNKSTLLLLTLLVLLVFITMGVLEVIRSSILVKIGAKIDRLLSSRAFELSFKQALFSGGQRVNTQPIDDLAGLRQFITGNGLIAFFDSPWLPFYVALLFLFHPLYGWFSIGTILVLVFLAYLNETLTSAEMTEANSLQNHSRVQIARNLANSDVISSLGMFKNFLKIWQDQSQQVISLQSVASSKASVISSLSKSTRLVSQSLILGVGAYLVIQREISPGVMIAGSILLGRALAPIDIIVANWKGFISARGQFERLNNLFNTFPSQSKGMRLPDPIGSVSFEQVIVVPPGIRSPTLVDVTLNIPQGKLIGVMGPSGSGKSTFAKALLGIWPLANGIVRIDGADIKSWDSDELGKHLGYLPQDIELFEGTVSQNIARFGNVDAEKVVKAAKLADVHDLILRLENGYDTIISANGMSLSGGQRQRIGLARALYDTPSVIVLDEPNSNLDEQGDIALFNTLQNLKKEKTTVIIVSHKPNVISIVDHLLILNEGKIGLYGTRDQVQQYIQTQMKSVESKSNRNKKNVDSTN